VPDLGQPSGAREAAVAAPDHHHARHAGHPTGGAGFPG
jgi:hypothetical protein